MQITIDTNEPLTDTDRQILAILTGVTITAAETKPAKAAPAKAAPAKAAAPKAEEPTADGPTVEQAVDAATKLVSTGGASKVKEALAAVGAKRVSELEAGQVAAFLAALDA